MTGRTGYTAPTNSNAPDGPAQIAAVYAHFDARVDATLATVAELPASGNWTGRTIYVTEDRSSWVWDTIWRVRASKWITYTPVITNFTVGNGTVSARYRHVGEDVEVRLDVTLGSTSAVSGSLDVPLPVTGKSGFTTFAQKGYGVATDASAATFVYLNYNLISTTTVRAYVINVANNYAGFSILGSTVPFTWAAGDQFSMELKYEKA